ncbi:F-box protein, partial [Quillaja saponaria]
VLMVWNLRCFTFSSSFQRSMNVARHAELACFAFNFCILIFVIVLSRLVCCWKPARSVTKNYVMPMVLFSILYQFHNVNGVNYMEQSFFLYKWYGKKCCMISARTLSFVCDDTPRHWKWTSLPEARFEEVAELDEVDWLEIRGRINTCMLSPKTFCTAYLVFKQTTKSYGFEYQPLGAVVGLAGDESHKRIIYLDAERGRRLQYRNSQRRVGL